MRAPVTLALLAGIGLGASSAWGSSPRAAGVWGARASALAGAASAAADDCTATFYNPANLSGRDADRRSWVCLEYAAGFAELDPGGHSKAERTLHTASAGLVSRGELQGAPFGVGALLVLPELRLSQIEALAANQASWVLDTNRPRISFGAFGVGASPLPWLSVGAALHVVAGLRGGFQVDGTLAQASPYDSRLRHAVDAELASARSFAASVTVRPSSDWQLAAVYRHRARVEQNIEGGIGGTLSSPPLPTDYRVQTRVVPATYPGTLSLAARVALGAGFGAAVELAFEDYSEWTAPDGRSRTELTLAGVPAALGPEPPAPASPSPHDRWVPRFGLDYTTALGAAANASLRAGYAFERSPLPEQRSSRWLDADRHHFAAGAGLETNTAAGTLRVDAFVLLTVLPSRAAVAAGPLGPALEASGTRAGFGVGTAYGF